MQQGAGKTCARGRELREGGGEKGAGEETCRKVESVKGVTLLDADVSGVAAASGSLVGMWYVVVAFNRYDWRYRRASIEGGGRDVAV